jgi:hypothetical protein
MNGLRIIANESQQTMNINNQSITTRLFLFPEPNGPIIKKKRQWISINSNFKFFSINFNSFI